MTASPVRMISLASAIAALGAALTATPASARTSGANVNAQVDLRYLATVEEEYFTDHGHYGTFHQLAHGEPDQMTIHRGVTVKIVHLQVRKAYCFRATTRTKTFVYDSLGGGFVKGKHCTVTKTGKSGGKRTGPASI
jgi:hypothetical protein